MIFFIDAPEMDMDNPAAAAFPGDRLVLDIGRSPDLHKIRYACNAGKHYVILRGESVLKIWAKWPARLAYLRLLTAQYGAYRVSTSRTPWHPKKSFPLKSMRWSTFVTKIRNPGWALNDALRASLSKDTYLGSTEPDYVFILRRSTDEGPVLKDAKGWRGWFLLCLKSADYSFDRIGFLAVSPNSLKESHTDLYYLAPRKGIIVTDAKFHNFGERSPAVSIVHPRRYYSPGIAAASEYVTALRAVARLLRKG